MTTTEKFNLPKVEGTDVPTWLTTFNNAMDKIEEALDSLSPSGERSGADITADVYSKLKYDEATKVVYVDEGGE